METRVNYVVEQFPTLVSQAIVPARLTAASSETLIALEEDGFSYCGSVPFQIHAKLEGCARSKALESKKIISELDLQMRLYCLQKAYLFSMISGSFLVLGTCLILFLTILRDFSILLMVLRVGTLTCTRIVERSNMMACCSSLRVMYRLLASYLQMRFLTTLVLQLMEPLTRPVTEVLAFFQRKQRRVGSLKKAERRREMVSRHTLQFLARFQLEYQLWTGGSGCCSKISLSYAISFLDRNFFFFLGWEPSGLLQQERSFWLELIYSQLAQNSQSSGDQLKSQSPVCSSYETFESSDTISMDSTGQSWFFLIYCVIKSAM